MPTAWFFAPVLFGPSLRVDGAQQLVVESVRLTSAPYCSDTGLSGHSIGSTLQICLLQYLESV